MASCLRSAAVKQNPGQRQIYKSRSGSGGMAIKTRKPRHKSVHILKHDMALRQQLFLFSLALGSRGPARCRWTVFAAYSCLACTCCTICGGQAEIKHKLKPDAEIHRTSKRNCVASCLCHSYRRLVKRGFFLQDPVVCSTSARTNSWRCVLVAAHTLRPSPHTISAQRLH